MKAVGLHRYLPIDDNESLIDLEITAPPAPVGRDLLVSVRAVSVNPVDTKLRVSKKGITEAEPRILGWDASGCVEAVGEQVEQFRVGDSVYYAGSVLRSGSNAELQLVDERLVAHKPSSLEHEQAAAIPLVGITAWETLFERMGLNPCGQQGAAGKSLLVIAGAGGVGSMAIQLAKACTKMTVIATASRPETRQWCYKMGSDYVIDHQQSLADQIKAIPEIGTSVDAIVCCHTPNKHWKAMADIIAPQGTIGLMVDHQSPLDMAEMKRKSVCLAWEFMFTRSLFSTPDMDRQGEILRTMATMIDNQTLITPCREVLQPINAANLRQAHQQLESGSTIGKVTLKGW